MNHQITTYSMKCIAQETDFLKPVRARLQVCSLPSPPPWSGSYLAKPASPKKI